MPKPDAPDTARGDKHALLAQLIGGPGLSIGRVLVGHLDHGRFDLRDNPVLEAGLPAGLLSKTFDALLLIGFLDVVKVLARDAVDFAGLGDVLKVLSQL